MRKITQFSSSDVFTQGTTKLVGAMGLPLAQVGTLGKFKGLDTTLFAERPKKILLHYLTEPPKINFVAVTSFLQGGVYGLDYARPTPPFPEVFSLRRDKLGAKVVEPGKGDIPVVDASMLISLSRVFLHRFPIEQGSLVFEAHSEIYTEKAGKIYALLAIARPKDPQQCYLLMEDAGIFGYKDTDRVKQESLALSIIGCEQAENIASSVQTEYEAIYLVGVFADVPAESWAQVQMIYCAPPMHAFSD